MLTFYVISLFLFLLNVTTCLKQYDENVCQDDLSGKLFCCFNSAEINDKCIECNLGFTSRDGSLCTPCEKNTYGNKCLKICSCSQFQRCDHVEGCVYIDYTTSKSKENTSKQIDAEDHSTQPDDANKGLSHRELVIYSSCAFVIIAGFGMYLIFRKYRRHNRNRGNPLKPETRNTITENASQENSTSNDYDEIDESILENEACLITHSASYLSVIGESSTHNSNENEDYLQPCRGFAETIINNNLQNDDQISAIGGVTAQRSVLDDLNLNKYQTLENEQDKMVHQYEAPVVIHKRLDLEKGELYGGESTSAIESEKFTIFKKEDIM